MNTHKPSTKRSSSTPRSTGSVPNADVMKVTSPAASGKSKKKKNTLDIVTSPKSVASKATSSKAVSPRPMVKPCSPRDKARFSSDSADLVGVFKYTCEEVIYDELIALKAIILKSNASRTFHDFSMLQGHVQSRAVTAVEEDLNQLSEKLLALRGPSPNHRVTVFAQLFASLTNEIEAAVFSVDRRSVYGLKNDHLAAKAVHDQQQTVYLEKLAKKDQTIQALQAEQTSMDFKNKSLVRTVELLSKELEKCHASLSNVHQRSVELRIQGIDFKAEVDKRAERILQSIQARVGFVPGTIQKHVSQLTQLLPPGDVNYDKARMEIYKRYPEGHGSSAPGTPTSTSRKAAQQVQTQTLAALTPHSPRSSFTSSSCPSTANVSLTQGLGQGQGQGQTPGQGQEQRSGHSPAPTPPKCQALNDSHVNNASYISSSTYSTEQAPSNAPRAATSAERIASQLAKHHAQNTSLNNSHHSQMSETSNMPFTHSLAINTTNNASAEPIRSALSPSSRAQQEQKRQVLITSLFPRSVTLQDTTGIAGISFPNAPAVVTSKQEARPVPVAQDFDMGGLSITGQAVKLRVAETEADCRYIAEMLDTDEMEEEGSEPEDSGSSPTPCNENDAVNENEDRSDGDDSDYEDTEFDGAETRTNPNASLPSRTSLTDATSDSSDSSDSSEDDEGQEYGQPYGRAEGIANQYYHGNGGEGNDSSTSDSDSDSSENLNSTSVGADDEHAPARRPSPSSSAVLSSTAHHAATSHMQYSQHTLPSTHLHASYNELYSESDEGSDFHRNMEKFIKDYREQQHANNSFKIDVSDSEIEPPGRKVSAGIAASGKRQANKTKGTKHGIFKKPTTAAASNGKKLPVKR